MMFRFTVKQPVVALVCVLALGACQRATPPAPFPAGTRTTTLSTVHRLRIATFNIENLGAAKLKKSDVVDVLVGIVRKYDIVAVQEIADTSLKTPTKFLGEIDRGTDAENYAMIASPRTGQQPADKRSQEQYAFYYDTRSVRVVDAGGLFPDDAENLFRREPFAAQFATTDDGESIVLITIHTDPDVAPAEIAALRKVHDWATARFRGFSGIILLGDFNAGVSYTRPTVLKEIRARDLPFLWIVPDDADTTLAVKPQAHDRIIVSGHLAQQFHGKWGIDRCFIDDRVSDHWPVWAEFEIAGRN